KWKNSGETGKPGRAIGGACGTLLGTIGWDRRHPHQRGLESHRSLALPGPDWPRVRAHLAGITPGRQWNDEPQAVVLVCNRRHRRSGQLLFLLLEHRRGQRCGGSDPDVLSAGVRLLASFTFGLER